MDNKDNEMEKLIRDGKVGVLVSPGYGAGWSTWACDRETALRMMFDPEIVHWVDVGVSPDKLEQARAKYPDASASGFDQLCVVWVPVGQKFMIREYDGSESIVFPEDYQWVEA